MAFISDMNEIRAIVVNGHQGPGEGDARSEASSCPFAEVGIITGVTIRLAGGGEATGRAASSSSMPVDPGKEHGLNHNSP